MGKFASQHPLHQGLHTYPPFSLASLLTRFVRGVVACRPQRGSCCALSVEGCTIGCSTTSGGSAPSLCSGMLVDCAVFSPILPLPLLSSFLFPNTITSSSHHCTTKNASLHNLYVLFIRASKPGNGVHSTCWTTPPVAEDLLRFCDNKSKKPLDLSLVVGLVVANA